MQRFNLREIFLAIRDCIVSPREFVKNHKKTQEPKSLIIYLLVITIFGFLLNVLSVIVIQPVFNQLYAQITQTSAALPTYNLNLIIPSLIQSVIAAILSALIVTTLLSFWLKLFSKKGTWQDVFQTYVYSQTPIAVFGWLPILSIIGLIESIYLLILGVEQSHELSRRTAVLVIVIPMLVLFLISIILSVVAFSLLSTTPQELLPQ